MIRLPACLRRALRRRPPHTVRPLDPAEQARLDELRARRQRKERER